ncbi:MAG TPA: hypothetical protein VJT31_10555, partial [Rugosimonospora sp.]|nr:hypothetical protein [Rugosimonospora sp.]
PELRAFWAGIAEPLIDDMAAGIEAARASGQALPAPPDAHDLARALTDMYWRAGRHASLDPPTPDAEQRLIDTLTVITLRAIYGADRVAG